MGAMEPLPIPEELSPDDLTGSPDLFADFEDLPAPHEHHLDAWRYHREIRVRALQAGFKLSVLDHAGEDWQFSREGSTVLTYRPSTRRWETPGGLWGECQARRLPELLAHLYPPGEPVFPRIFRE
jgi:hypothetical protein